MNRLESRNEQVGQPKRTGRKEKFEKPGFETRCYHSFLTRLDNAKQIKSLAFVFLSNPIQILK